MSLLYPRYKLQGVEGYEEEIPIIDEANKVFEDLLRQEQESKKTNHKKKGKQGGTSHSKSKSKSKSKAQEEGRKIEKSKGELDLANMGMFVAVSATLCELPLGLRLGGSEQPPYDVWVS